jgi:Lar family restriction alleviation protein
MTELKPCPFCGETERIAIDTIADEVEDSFAVICGGCAAATKLTCRSREEAIAAWNRRAAPEAPSDMKSEYIVRDDDGNISWSEWPEGPESFKTFHAAERRAKELAALAPGKAIGIYELVAETTVPIGAVATGRKYPREHYK